MRSRTHFSKLRELILKAAQSLSDADALDGIELFDPWAANTAYEADTRIRYNGRLYKVVQSHTGQSDWTPDITPALYTPVAEPWEIPVWVQPTGAQDAYMKGDKVHYPTKEDPVYISVIDNNVWAPDVTGWEIEQ